jgi:hypothetical protein
MGNIIMWIMMCNGQNLHGNFDGESWLFFKKCGRNIKNTKIVSTPKKICRFLRVLRK